MVKLTLERAKVPMVMANDRETLETATRCNWGVPPEETRMMRIPNTLHLEYLYVSENLVDEALHNDNVEVVEEATEMQFDEDGNLPDFDTGGSEHRTRGAPDPDDGYFTAY